MTWPTTTYAAWGYTADATQVIIVTCRFRYVWVPDTRSTGQMPPRYAGASAFAGSRYAAPAPYSGRRGAGAWFRVAPDAMNHLATGDTYDPYSEEEWLALMPAGAPEDASADFSPQRADLIGGQDIEHDEQFFE